MTSSMTTNRNEALRQRAQVDRLLGDMAELLAEIVDAEADAWWHTPTVPTDAIAGRISELCSRLRVLFTLEKVDESLDELLATQPGLRGEFEKLCGQRCQLLGLLEEIDELADPAARAATRWSDVETRFRCFQQQLSHHPRRHGSLGQSWTLSRFATGYA